MRMHAASSWPRDSLPLVLIERIDWHVRIYTLSDLIIDVNVTCEK